MSTVFMDGRSKEKTKCHIIIRELHDRASAIEFSQCGDRARRGVAAHCKPLHRHMPSPGARLLEVVSHQRPFSSKGAAEQPVGAPIWGTRSRPSP